MLIGVKRSLLLWASAVALQSASPAFARPPLPPIPRPDGLPSGVPIDAEGAGGGSAALPSPRQLYEHVRRGVVALERNGIPVAIGTVLDGDGRILTSLSALGAGGRTDARYADGTVTTAKIGSEDGASDLALLVPQTIKSTEGLAASESDPVGRPLHTMLPSRGAGLGPAEADVKGRVETHARDGASLPPMLDVMIKGPLVGGAPLLDGAGGVVGVLVRACKGAAEAPPPDSAAWAAWGAAQTAPTHQVSTACAPVVVGAPVSTIRSFLSKSPTAPTPTPWLGMRGETSQGGNVRGVRVVAVAPSSPCEKAGLRPGADVVVAADGHPVDTPESLGQTIGRHAPGDAVTLLVFGEDKFREVSVVLVPAP
jgi:S1-C subfamily serine protease